MSVEPSIALVLSIVSFATLLRSTFGFFAGILGGAYNTNGPPVVIYGSLRKWSPATFRATLQGYFFMAAFFCCYKPFKE